MANNGVEGYAFVTHVAPLEMVSYLCFLKTKHTNEIQNYIRGQNPPTILGFALTELWQECHIRPFGIIENPSEKRLPHPNRLGYNDCLPGKPECILKSKKWVSHME